MKGIKRCPPSVMFASGVGFWGFPELHPLLFYNNQSLAKLVYLELVKGVEIG